MGAVGQRSSAKANASESVPATRIADQRVLQSGDIDTPACGNRAFQPNLAPMQIGDSQVAGAFGVSASCRKDVPGLTTWTGVAQLQPGTKAARTPHGEWLERTGTGDVQGAGKRLIAGEGVRRP